MYTKEQLMEKAILLSILITYDTDNMQSIRTMDNSVYGQATKQRAIEEGFSIDIVGNTLYITIDLSKVT